MIVRSMRRVLRDVMLRALAGKTEIERRDDSS
jgi:hypothetical protein